MIPPLRAREHPHRLYTLLIEHVKRRKVRKSRRRYIAHVAGGAYRKQFEALAQPAEVRSGHPGGPSAVFAWPDRLKAEGGIDAPKEVV